MDGGSRGDTGSNSGDTSPNHNIANITGGAIDSHHNNDNKNSTANGMAKNHTLGRLKCLAYQANSLWIGGNSSFSLSIFDVSPTSSSSSSPIPSSPSASSSATSAMSMPMSNSLSIPVSTPMSTSFAPHFSTTPGTSLTNSRSKHLPRQPGLRRQQQQVQRHGTPVQPSLSSLALPVSPLPFVDASFSSSYIATPLPKSHATAHTRSHSPPAHMLIRPSSKTAAPVAASSPSGLMPASAAAAVAEGPVRDAGMNANAGERKAVSPLELRRSVSFSEATPLSPTSPGSPSIDLPLPLPSPAFASLEALPVPSDVSTALSTWGLLHGLERDIRRNTSLKAGVIDAAMQQKKKALLKGLDEDQRHRLLLYLLHNEAKGEAVDEDLKENIVRVLAYPHTPAPATTPQRRGKRGGPGGEDGETGKGQTTNMHKKTTSKSGHSNSSYKHGSGDSGDAGGRVSSPLRQPFASSSSPSFLSQTLASAQTPLNRRSRHRHQHHSQHTWQRSSSASTSSPPAPRSAMKGKRGETHTHTRHVSATQHASAHTRTNTTGAIDANTDLDLLEIDKVNVNLMREVRVMRETVGQLTSKNAHLSSEKKRLASSLGELRGKYKSQRKLLQSMQSNVQTKDIIRQLEHEKHVLHTRVQSLQGELDTRSNAYTQREMHTNTRITDLETEREQARGEVADAKLRVTMLQEEQSKIRTAMVDVGKECLQVKWAHLLSNGIHDLPSVVPANGSISKVCFVRM